MAHRSRVVLGVLVVLMVAAWSRAAGPPMMSQGTGDTRRPLFLQPMMAEHQKQNMREHLAAVQAIVAAVGRDDMDAVTTAVSRIGYSEAIGRASFRRSIGRFRPVSAATPRIARKWSMNRRGRS